MKKLLLAMAGSICASAAVAQPWLQQTQPGKQTLQSLTEAYNAPVVNAAEENEHVGKQVKEGKNYHYRRWVWYWERHLDTNGVMVSPLQTLHEWQNWQQQYARSQHKGTANVSDWRFMGPDKSPGGYNGIGRINVVAFHPTDTNTFWAGSAGGGAWKTSDFGITWTAVNDYFPVLGVSDIDFNPQNPNTIYLCTGDRDASDTYSIGILKSTDGGNTWDTTGMKYDRNAFVLTNTLVINPLDTNSLTLAASNGIFKSFDAGATWTMISGGSFKEVLYHPTDTTIMYAAGFTNGSSQVFRSANGGLSWTQSTTFPGNTRVSVAVTPGNVAIVKAIVANSSNGLEGIYTSSDTGKTFTKIFDGGTNCSTNLLATTPRGNQCGGQGWYDLTIAISPVDTNFVMVGGVNSWYSADGGYNWTIANQWTSSLPGIKVVHADKHYHRYHPLRPDMLFECNDGGLYFSTDPSGGVWTDITNGMGITQFYRNAVSPNATFVLGGAQDNGSKHLQDGTFRELTGGDGMDCQIDYSDPDIFYTSIQYGELRRTTNGGGNFQDIARNIPGQPTGDWITPFVIDPQLPNVLYAGYDKLYRSIDRGDTWEPLTGTFGGKIKRVTKANNATHIYFLVNNRINASKDGGQTWNYMFPNFSGSLSDVKVDPKDPEVLWVTYNGYGLTQVAQYTPANSWKEYNTGLPRLPVNCVEIDAVDGTVYVGTDVGVFYKTKDVDYWEPYNSNLPTAEVIDLGINNAKGEICAATYGRGMWVSPTISFPLNVASVPYSADVATVSPNPNNGRFSIHANNTVLKGQQVNIRIVSMTGATVWQNAVALSASGNAAIDAQLPKGTYIVTIEKNGVAFAKNKMVVQ